MMECDLFQVSQEATITVLWVRNTNFQEAICGHLRHAFNFSWPPSCWANCLPFDRPIVTTAQKMTGEANGYMVLARRHGCGNLVRAPKIVWLRRTPRCFGEARGPALVPLWGRPLELADPAGTFSRSGTHILKILYYASAKPVGGPKALGLD